MSLNISLTIDNQHYKIRLSNTNQILIIILRWTYTSLSVIALLRTSKQVIQTRTGLSDW